MLPRHLFASYFIGGFECSTHRRRNGQRLDLLAATHHDAAVDQDYRLMREHGIRTVRDGLRWHRIETSPGRYDWSSFLPMLRAARDLGVQVIWDLCHYGWPDDIDIWTPDFVERFSRFAAAAARLVRDETDGVPLFCPVNEISYWAWAGGEVGKFNPLARRRGPELKRQLARTSIAGIEAVWDVCPQARIVHAEPVIHIVSRSDRPHSRRHAENYRQAQFQAWDMLSGRLCPELGGKPDYLDIIGVNYYSDNQWFQGGGTIELGHPRYRPFREILAETYRRYERPLFVAETGAEAGKRALWLRYVAGEVHAARIAGIPVDGICLYPIVDYPGWENDRHCETGLLGRLDERGRRPIHQPLAAELRSQRAIFETVVARPEEPAAATRIVG